MRRAARLTAATVAVAVVVPAASLLPSVPSAGGAASGSAAAVPGENGLIAFVSDRDDGSAIYVMEPDGGGVTRVIEDGGFASDPAWSPDGSRIAFHWEVGEIGNGLYVVNADGSDVTWLPGAPSDAQPAWSPDGSRILFTRDQAGAPAYHDIWVMDADGSDQRLLVAAPPGDDDTAPGTVTSPAWSPDGGSIVYTRASLGTVGTELVVADSDGTNPRSIHGPVENVASPDWSPDGRRIVFKQGGGTPFNHDIYVIDADGGNLARLTSDPDRELDPVWSPDGGSILYSRDDPVLPGLWRMAADGSGQARISTDDSVTDWQPSWQAVPPPYTLSVTPSAGEQVTHEQHAVDFVLTDPDGDPDAFEDVLLAVDGANPHRSAVLTDGAGSARYGWTGTQAGTDTLSACADLDSDGTCEALEPTATATVTWTDPPGPFDPPRVAFTDDDDALYRVQVGREESDTGERHFPVGAPDSYTPGLNGYQPGPRHEGEAGGVPGEPPAFVSTRHDPSGEVYIGTGADVDRITCNDLVETHPVVFGDGLVAYAADSDPGPEEDWDIYVASVPVEGPARPAPGWSRQAPRASDVADTRAEQVSTVAPGSCDGQWSTVRVTEGPANDLWPTWTYDGSLVFSRAEDGQLADLWSVGPAPTSTGWAAPVNLTSSPDDEETQPAAMQYQVDLGPPPGCELNCFPIIEEQDWIAFSIVELGGEAEIAFLSPDDPGTVVFSGLHGREPAWSSLTNPDHLAYTSTDQDPYGDIWVAPLESPDAVQGEGTDPPIVDLDDQSNLAEGLQGVAESHPFWLEPFGDPDADDAVIVFTARSDVDLARRSRILDADVGDVRQDGTQRRVLRQAVETVESEVVHRYDEAGPAYSPDGSRIVYSRDAYGEGESFDARVLMVADADGSNAEPLLPPAGRAAGDIDSDPVWSPDGRRVAFVRSDTTGEDRRTGVWVYEIGAPGPVRISGELAGGGQVVDRHPTWSPDSEWIMVGRSIVSESPTAWEQDGGRRQPATDRSYGPSLWILDPDDPEGEGWALDTCQDLCSVDGRSPAWSPLGDTVAYVDSGTLYTVAVGAAPDEFSWPAEDPVAATGFRYDADLDDMVVTESRYVLSSAEDPAWNADGTEIFFAGQPVGQPDNRGIYRLAYAEVDGEPQTADEVPEVVTDDRGPETEPAAAPRTADVQVDVTVTGSPAEVGQTVLATFTVTNAGPAPANGVELTTTYAPGAVRTVVAPLPGGCQASGLRCDFAVLAPGESRTYRVRIRHDTSGTRVVHAAVTSTTPDPVPANNTDKAKYRLLRADVGDLKVKVRVDEPVGYVGGFRTVTVVVRNLGPDPVVDATLRLEWPQAFLQRTFVGPLCLAPLVSCPLGTMNPGDRIEYELPLALVAPGDRLPIVGTVSGGTPDRDTRNNISIARLDVLQPELHILPGVARPGQVVIAYGENMPPGSEIEIDWRTQTPGGVPLADPITIDPGPYLIGDDGTVRIPLPVIRRDFLGERILTATSTTGEFLDLEATLLVVLRSLGPPQFVERG